MRQRIFAYHLLNDYSGSPKVLSQLLKGWRDTGLEVHLTCNVKNRGFLSDIPGIVYHNNMYRFYNFIPFRLVMLVMSQLHLMISMIFTVSKKDIVYVNTVLPFGAAIIGWLKGAKVVYHMHETSMKPKMLKSILFNIVQWTASDVVCVSNFLANNELPDVKKTVIWNALDEGFAALASRHQNVVKDTLRVLMVASLKKYKGIDEYVTLAKASPDIAYDLVLNADQQAIDIYFAGVSLPSNLCIHTSQSNMHTFYQKADVVLNMSRPEEWVETFGLTALEGMAYGLPVIVPPVGGISEIVIHDVTGYHVDGRNTWTLVALLRKLHVHKALYRRLSMQAKIHALRFSEHQFVRESLSALSELHKEELLPKFGIHN
jgi:L-malate glycosyltransferase